jgi:hypothetical protein
MQSAACSKYPITYFWIVLVLETYSFKFSYRIDAYTVTYTTLDSSVYLSFVTFDLQPVFAGDELGAHYTPYNYFQLSQHHLKWRTREMGRMHALGQRIIRHQAKQKHKFCVSSNSFN